VQVKNVALYLTEMQRSLTDKLAKNFFNDPSQVRDCRVDLAMRIL
jgi:catabolite regulation protein CreA